MKEVAQGDTVRTRDNMVQPCKKLKYALKKPRHWREITSNDPQRTPNLLRHLCARPYHCCVPFVVLHLVASCAIVVLDLAAPALALPDSDFAVGSATLPLVSALPDVGRALLKPWGADLSPLSPLVRRWSAAIPSLATYGFDNVMAPAPHLLTRRCMLR